MCIIMMRGGVRGGTGGEGHQPPPPYIYIYIHIYTYIHIYRKIPNVSPGLIEVFKHFLGGLYSGGLTFGGAYIRRAFCVSVRVSRP